MSRSPVPASTMYLARRRIPLCLSVAVVQLACVVSACGATGGDTIRIAADPYVGAKVVQVGSYFVRRDPTYRGARAAFGPARSCRLGRSDDAIATWKQRGIVIHLARNSGYPNGHNACMAPASAYVDTLLLTGDSWRTERGLRVGDRVDRLHDLYPRASLRQGQWWLEVARGFAGVNAPHPYPALAASPRDGRVSSFTLRIGAQGD
jgi:hypothetical protein